MTLNTQSQRHSGHKEALGEPGQVGASLPVLASRRGTHQLCFPKSYPSIRTDPPGVCGPSVFDHGMEFSPVPAQESRLLSIRECHQLVINHQPPEISHCSIYTPAISAYPKSGLLSSPTSPRAPVYQPTIQLMVIF